MPFPSAGQKRLLRAAVAALAVSIPAPGPGVPDRDPGRSSRTLIFLPGTQPGTSDTVAGGGAASCGGCHTPAADRSVPIGGEWAGGMMAHSARDPVFYAALAIANKYSTVTGDNTGEYCIRCHSPSGWLAARSEDITAQSLRGTDLDGVQCDYCHRIVDPLNPDTTVPPSVVPVPGYGNGMHMVQASDDVRRGPRADAAAPHAALADSFQSSGNLCGICHDVSNPFQTRGQERIDLAPHAYAPLERTYSEWLMSSFPSEGPSGACQGCHMGRVAGYAASTPGAPHRSDVRSHDLTGGNTFVPSILPDFWEGLDTSALASAAARAAATLGRAALLSGTAALTGGGVAARIRVTNLTGHKLPTGYPEGRRMWLTITGFDGGGDTVHRSGVYDTAAADLVADPEAKVYEAVLGLTDSTAAVYGLPPGPSFFFSLNDTVLHDNRIPPRGFTNASFAARLAPPVGASYADGEHWDEAEYAMPAATRIVEAGLWYQTISRPYVEFLRDENAGNVFDWNEWGRKLHEAWESHGRSAPVLMASLSIPVDTLTGAPDPAPLPAGYRLDPAYPNPFNGAARIRFTIPAASDVTVTVTDAAGRAVAALAGGRYSAGAHTVVLGAAGLSSGVYVVRMTAGTFRASQKLLLVR